MKRILALKFIVLITFLSSNGFSEVCPEGQIDRTSNHQCSTWNYSASVNEWGYADMGPCPGEPGKNLYECVLTCRCQFNTMEDNTCESQNSNWTNFSGLSYCSLPAPTIITHPQFAGASDCFDPNDTFALDAFVAGTCPGFSDGGFLLDPNQLFCDSACGPLTPSSSVAHEVITCCEPDPNYMPEEPPMPDDPPMVEPPPEEPVMPEDPPMVEPPMEEPPMPEDPPMEDPDPGAPPIP